ncbi:MFS transporter, DHA1 family, bicyclomycin/chloramphenicol resistance protein [Nonomuraea solani]|uniref:MFS transporter, DHA1 family, bicyclomycin/chloramphenicol resistance protein n=1 Tax=Nonomuraea solani TaxID=1144553 RepID=A0A1H6EVC9_9ACTN|nr:multidrug effflux MFS transporter [Nonomuraea solani]SEH00644.1 MFS transporter, DHA1 family, bicyclomycin/chloramphenicol resistance protein [Nonomuraea solani]
MSVAVEATPTAVLPKQRSRRRGLLLVILGALSAIGPLSIDMYLPALPAITSEMLSAPAQVQLTLTACLIGVSVGQIIAGPVSDVRGRRIPLMVGVAGFMVASLLCAFAPSVTMLIVFRLLQGILGGAALVIVRAVVRDLYDGAAIARIFATLMLVSGLAPILAPIAGAQLLAFTSWRGVFVALSVAGLVLLLAVLAGVRETLPPEARESGGLKHTAGTFWQLLRNRSFMGFALTGGLAFAAMFGYISGSPFVLQEVYGATPQQYSLIFALNALALTVTAQLGGRLSGRVPPVLLVRLGLFIALVGGVVLMTAALAGFGLWGIVSGLVVIMLGQGLVLPGTGALALGSQPAHVAGSASALTGVLQFALGAASAPLVGLAGSGTAVPMACVMLGLIFCSALTFMILGRAKVR